MIKLKKIQENLAYIKANLEEVECALKHPKIYLVCKLPGDIRLESDNGHTIVKGIRPGVFVLSAHLDHESAVADKKYREETQPNNKIYTILDVDITIEEK